MVRWTYSLDAESRSSAEIGNARSVGVDCGREHLGCDQRRAYRRVLEGRADCARAGEFCARAVAWGDRIRGRDCVALRMDAAAVGRGRGAPQRCMSGPIDLRI